MTWLRKKRTFMLFSTLFPLSIPFYRWSATFLHTASSCSTMFAMFAIWTFFSNTPHITPGTFPALATILTICAFAWCISFGRTYQHYKNCKSRKEQYRFHFFFFLKIQILFNDTYLLSNPFMISWLDDQIIIYQLTFLKSEINLQRG